jgi:hypothetical protein
MKDSIIRKMLADALRSHPHASLIADVIVDCLKTDGYAGVRELSSKPAGLLLVDALAGVDNRSMLPVGSTVVAEISEWNLSPFDVSAMVQAGVCVEKDWYVATVSETRPYSSVFPYSVVVEGIDKEGFKKELTDQCPLQKIRPWVESK